MVKKLSIILSLCLILVLFTACSNSTPDTSVDSEPASTSQSEQAQSQDDNGEKKYKVGVSMSSRDQFLSTLEQGILEAAKEKGNFEVVTFDSNNDVQKQYEHINTFASGGFDVMIINLVDTNTSEEVIGMAGDVPIVFVDRRPDDDLLVQDKHCYVGAEEYTAGQYQGEFLSEYFKDKEDKTLRYVLFKGILGLENTEMRTRGVLETLEKNGFTLEKVFEDTADYDRAKALDKMNTLLGTGKGFDCVIANNDEMALGAIEAMKLSGADLSTIPVVGIDCTEVAASSIRSKDLACSIYQNPLEVGQACFAQAYEVATTGKMIIFKDVPFKLVTIDNIDEVLGQ